MDCSAAHDHFSAYVDRQLDVGTSAKLESHLTGCTTCRDALASLQKMVHSLGQLESPTAPDLVPGVRARLERQPWWMRMSLSLPGGLPIRGLALAATAVLVIVTVVSPRFLRGRTQGDADALRAESYSKSLNRQAAKEPIQYAAYRDAQQHMEHRQMAFGARESEADDVAGRGQDQEIGHVLERLNTLTIMPAATTPVPGSGGGSTGDAVRLAQQREAPEVGRHRALAAKAAGAAAPLATESMRRKSVRLAAGITTETTVDAPEMSHAIEMHEMRFAQAQVEDTRTVSALVSMSKTVAEEPRKASASPVRQLLQLEWTSPNPETLRDRAREWVRVRRGLIVQPDDAHLIIKLPRAALNDFFMEFPQGAPAAAAAPMADSDDSADADATPLVDTAPVWVSLSITLRAE